MLAAACGSGTRRRGAVVHDDDRRAGDAKPADVPGRRHRRHRDARSSSASSLIDFKCIPSAFVDSIYVNQQQAYQAFIDDINENGGINGRKIVPVFKYICPLQPAAAVAACTSLTDDTKVFAVIGSMYDPTGDAQLCVAKQHKTVLITDGAHAGR